MVNTRRSLGDALSLTPEKLAFIQGGTVPASAQHPLELSANSPTIELKTPVDSQSPGAPRNTRDEDGEGTEPPSKPRRSRAPVRSRVPLELGDEEPLAPILAPLTTRLHPATADALRRACLEQRLRRRRPFTQQEIVELAVRDWLETYGFLDRMIANS